MHLSCVFFFQAEDGIRDLVRSRGLGDVYKRQPEGIVVPMGCSMNDPPLEPKIALGAPFTSVRSSPVSYTHLTLPTSDLV